MPLNGARPVSGRYSGARDRFAVELRVDIDGARPTKRVSADYFRDGRYFGSMRVDAPHIAYDRGAVTIVGKPRFSWPSSPAAVRVTIPHDPTGAQAPTATLSHLTASGDVASTYSCEYDAPSFRRVMLSETRQQGVTPFSRYDTASLPCAGPRRELSLRSAYAEAGIELASDGPENVVDVPAQAVTWSDAELQAAMQEYFTRLDERPQWAIWLLHAWAHDDPSLFGMMFDRRGRQRQGCAIFYKNIAGADAPSRRNQLYTCVHEVGHCFNLLHSWQKSRARPPVPSRPGTFSWMNYAQRFPGGAERYWPQFPFQFDMPELVHLRHAFHEDVIMGGSPLEGGAASRGDLTFDDERVSGALRLRIGAPASFGLGTPVTIAIEVASTVPGLAVPAWIGPRAGNLDVVIRGPGGDVTLFDPLLEHCHGDDAITLRPEDGPRRHNAFLHYGKSGFHFDRPGRYAIRARHTTPGGTVALSNVLSIDVRPARTRHEREVSRLVCANDDVGALLSLTGSAAPVFDGANRTLDEIIERHPTTEVAMIARVVRATGLARPFKHVVPGEPGVRTRPADPARAVALIAPVVDLPAVYRAMSTTRAGTDRQRAAVGLARVGIRRGVPAVVASYVESRLLEIASAIASPQMAEHAVPQPTPLSRPAAVPDEPGGGGYGGYG